MVIKNKIKKQNIGLIKDPVDKAVSVSLYNLICSRIQSGNTIKSGNV